MIEKSSKSLNEGVSITEHCTSSFDKMEKDSKEINEMVNETFTAFKEQSIAVAEISKAVESLDLLGQQNAESAKEAALQAQKIQEEANDMISITGQLNEIIKGQKAV